MSDQTDLIQGTLDLLILRTIALEPMHGWAIAQRIQQISDDLLRVQQGSLYPALHRLEHQGWITAEWGASDNNRRARYYSRREPERQLRTEVSKWAAAVGRGRPRPEEDMTMGAGPVRRTDARAHCEAIFGRKTHREMTLTMNVRTAGLMAAAGLVLATMACGGVPGPHSSGPGAAQAADAIYVGGDIVTVNDAQPTADALAVKDGKILAAVGTRSGIEQNHKGTSTKVVDLGGKTLLPGFIDAHGHYISALTVANQVNLYAPPAGPGTDPDAIVKDS